MGFFNAFSSESKSSTQHTTNTIDNDLSTVVDGAGINSTTIVQNLVGSPGATITDYGAVEKAIELSKHSLTESWDFVEDSLEFVGMQSERNYDFADNVAIPLTAQQTDEFSQNVIVASVVLGLGMLYFLKGGL